jgi:hypothetical protein
MTTTAEGGSSVIAHDGATRLVERVIGEVTALTGGRLRPEVVRLLTDVTVEGYAIFLRVLAGDDQAGSSERMAAVVGTVFDDVAVTLEDALALHRHLERVLLREVLASAPVELAGTEASRIEAAAHRFFSDLAVVLTDRYLSTRRGHDADRAATETDLLAALLSSPPQLGQARHLARTLGVDLDGPWQVAVYAAREGKALAAGADAVVRRALFGSTVLVGTMDSGLVVAVHPRGGDVEWPALGPGVTCGCGSEHPEVRGLRDSYEEALEVLDLAQRRALPRLHVEDAWFDRFLIGSLTAEEMAERVLAPLGELTANRQAVVLETLEAYLDSGGSVTAVAEALHLHRQSVNYRMQNVRRLFGARLATPNGRLALHIAVKARRLKR